MQDQLPDRNMKDALHKGWRRRCPRCGHGALLNGYLTVGKSCSNCAQSFEHHRADDGPAYITILFVGHLMAPLLHIFFVHFRPEPWVTALVFCTGCLALCLYLLPRVKGCVIAFQWARYMHGFGKESTGITK